MTPVPSRFARIYELALDSLDDESAALTWLCIYSKRLQDIPVRLIQTEAGYNAVKQELLRLLSGDRDA